MRYSNGDQAGEGLKKGIPFGRHAPTYPDAGHSLRAGLATAAAAGGTQERDIMRQTGHRSVQMSAAPSVTARSSAITPPRPPGRELIPTFLSSSRGQRNARIEGGAIALLLHDLPIVKRTQAPIDHRITLRSERHPQCFGDHER